MGAVRAWSLAVLVVAMGLAGCIGAKDDKGANVKLGNVTNDAVFVKPPDGRGGQITAFEETNRTEASGIGAMAHTHDYWNGRTRVTLFDVQTFMAPNSGGANPSTVTLYVPKGGLVFEGTNSVEFTISDPQRHACEGRIQFNNHFVCTDDNADLAPYPPVSAPDPTGGPAGLKLRYMHASTSTWIDAGELKWGAPTIIKITDAKQTDMPHSTTSLWQFQVVSPNGYDSTLEFHVKADIVRDPSVPIALWPAHPLFYTNDSHVRQVYDGEATYANGYVSTLAGLQKTDAANGPVTPKRLITFGTRSVYVWANTTSVDAPNPATAPTSWYLLHTNATGRQNITDSGNASASSDGKNFFWILPVTPDDMDSPYQESSRWQFALAGELANCINCADYTVKYHLTVKSSDLDETGRYTLYCWDSNDCKTGS